MQRRLDLLVQQSEEQVSLTNGPAGLRLRMDATARRIWHLLERPVTVASLCASLRREYEATEADLEADVLGFLEELRSEGLVHVVAGEAPAVGGMARSEGAAGTVHLFLALGEGAWGEASAALEVATRLARRGATAVFLTSGQAEPLFRAGPFRYHLWDGLGPRFGAFLDELLEELRPVSLVLADLAATEGALRSVSLDPAGLLRLGVPVISMELWGLGPGPYEVDRYEGKTMTFNPCPGLFERILRPVPCNLLGLPGSCSLLPEENRLTESRRSEERAALGLAASDRGLLFCSTKYQHIEDPDAAGGRLAAAFPRLLMDYVQELGPRAQLLHVGPAAFEAGRALGSQYRFLGQLPPAGFRRLVGAADLMINANITGRTVGEAIAASLPVLVLLNGCAAATPEEARAWLGHEPSPRVKRFLAETLPLSPFVTWPLGFSQLLRPLLSGNPYCAAFRTVELLREEEVLDAAAGLLWDAEARWRLQASQADYARLVRELPDPVSVIDACLR